MAITNMSRKTLGIQKLSDGLTSPKINNLQYARIYKSTDSAYKITFTTHENSGSWTSSQYRIEMHTWKYLLHIIAFFASIIELFCFQIDACSI